MRMGTVIFLLQPPQSEQRRETEYSYQKGNSHSSKEQQSGQSMQKSISFQSESNQKVQVILEFPEPTKEAKQAESEFIGLLKAVYLEKILKSYMQEEESALESISTIDKEDNSHE